mgnify:CR=1 FL=1
MEELMNAEDSRQVPAPAAEGKKKRKWFKGGKKRRWIKVLLILVIQGSVWLNFSFPTLQNSPVYFLSYLIVSSIQMGANIDYAIVISSRYQELKNKMPRREAMIETLNLSFPTVFTSGTIMASAGIFISKMTTDPAIYAVGLCIGRGTIISMLLVMGILPGILLLGDTIIDRTTFNIKYPAIVQTTEAVGMVRLDGRIRGTVSGKIDAEVHGVLMGDVSAVISAAFFGIYHGNVLQAVYAFILGALFAWFLEMGGNKWTSVLMHIGANTWILIFSEYAQTLVEKTGAGSLLMIYGIFAVVMIGGYQYFVRRGEKRGYRAV